MPDFGDISGTIETAALESSSQSTSLDVSGFGGGISVNGDNGMGGVGGPAMVDLATLMDALGAPITFAAGGFLVGGVLGVGGAVLGAGVGFGAGVLGNILTGHGQSMLDVLNALGDQVGAGDPLAAGLYSAESQPIAPSAGFFDDGSSTLAWWQQNPSAAGGGGGG